MGRYYGRAERLLERGDKFKSAEEWALAVKCYKEAIDNFDRDQCKHPVDHSYQKAEVYVKMAFCYEMLIDKPNRNDCYEKAAQNYEHMSPPYTEWAKRYRELCRYGPIKKKIETEDELKEYVSRTENTKKDDVPTLVKYTTVPPYLAPPLKILLVNRMALSIIREERYSLASIATSISENFGPELSKNKEVKKQLEWLKILADDMKKCYKEVREIGASVCEELGYLWSLGIVKEFEGVKRLKVGD